MIVLHMKYYLADEIKKYEMVDACGTYGGGEVHTGFWWEKLRERPCERPRWDCNIEIDLKEIESGGGVN